MKSLFTLKHFLLFIEILFFTSLNQFCIAQSSCTNADFEQNSFVGWSGTTGTCCPISSTNPGIVSGRHTIMTGPGTDPFTNGQLTVVAPGGQYSARLGNSSSGSEAEQLIYSFNVGSVNEMFIYRYAVVFEDPNHTVGDQPRFEIRVYDQTGFSVPCGTYLVYSSAGIPGFKTENINGSVIRWKDWTTVGIDLSSYVGQTVTIEFSTSDCGLGAHFGYAYIDCYCSPLTISSDYCPGSNVANMVAPPGFEGYLWSTGDTTQSITVNNPQIGVSYTVTLISVSGCSVTLTNVLSPGSISPSFIFQNQCNYSAQFSNTSTATNNIALTNILWDFGDGTTSTLSAPTHVYSTPGLYNVKLTVGSQSLCDSSITLPVNIIGIPNCDFSFALQCEDAPVQFTDNSTSQGSTITSWSWNFGDGLPGSITQNPLHTYSTQNNFSVSLIVKDLNGCADTIAKTISVLPNPIALISAQDACANKIVLFKDSSFVSTGNIKSWHWNFGDNSPASTLQNPAHLYSGPGAHTVSLRVTSNNGCLDSITKLLNIFPAPNADFISTGVCVNNPINFTDKSSDVYSAVTGWLWNFGDGSTLSNIRNPIHSYNSEANYTVLFIASNNVGCIDSAEKQLAIHPNPVANFSADTACLNKETKFTNLSSIASGNINSWNWNFGDRLSSHIYSPVHKYKGIGIYDVNLIVVSEQGCIDSTKGVVEVKEDYSFWIPNAFTPNADDLNDVFKPLVIGAVEYRMEIYDRWGIKIFVSNSELVGWDAKIDDRPAQADVYVYRILITDVCSETHSHVGHFSLLR